MLTHDDVFWYRLIEMERLEKPSVRISLDETRSPLRTQRSPIISLIRFFSFDRFPSVSWQSLLGRSWWISLQGLPLGATLEIANSNKKNGTRSALSFGIE